MPIPEAILRAQACIQTLENDVQHVPAENAIQSLTELSNIASGINNAIITGNIQETMYSLGVRIWNLPLRFRFDPLHESSKAEGLRFVAHARSTGFEFIKAATLNPEHMSEKVAVQRFELACKVGKAWLDTGDLDKARKFFNEAKDLEAFWPALTSEMPVSKNLQLSLYLYLAEMQNVNTFLQMNAAMRLLISLDLDINEVTTIEKVAELCDICFRASRQCLLANNPKESLRWWRCSFTKVEEKALAVGMVIPTAIRLQRIKVHASILLEHGFEGNEMANEAENSLSSISDTKTSDILLHFLWLKLKIAYSNVEKEELAEEQFEKLYVIKFHIIATLNGTSLDTTSDLLWSACEEIESIMKDLEEATISGIQMVLWQFADNCFQAEKYRSASLFYECANHLHEKQDNSSENQNILRRKLAVCYYDNRQYELAEEILEKNLLKDSSRKNAMDILLMVIVLAAKGETAEAERYLQEMHNGHGFKVYMFKLVADAYSQSDYNGIIDADMLLTNLTILDT
ncbi:unnamed protein product [Umbelopsis vinacea]